LSPEEKAEISAKAKEAKKKEEIKLLKAQALAPPRYRQINIWAIYVRENLTAQTNNGPVTSQIKALAQNFKNITSREREHYNHLVNEHNAKSLREFQEWLNAHTPAQIKEANAVRARLRKNLADKKSQYLPIKDDRLVKRPSSSYLLYHSERITSGDFRGVSTPAASKDISVEFKALSASEKKVRLHVPACPPYSITDYHSQKYEDLAAKDFERYVREHLEVYGFEKPASTKVVKTTLAEADADVAPSA
jgi:hypothetical protein